MTSDDCSQSQIHAQNAVGRTANATDLAPHNKTDEYTDAASLGNLVRNGTVVPCSVGGKVCAGRIIAQCPAAWVMAAARSAGRLHIGQCPVGRSTSSRLLRVATSAIIGSPARAICIITSEGYEQAMIVDGTFRRDSFLRCTGVRMTVPGSGTAR